MSLPVYEEPEDTRHRSTRDTGIITVYSMAHLPTDVSEPSQTVYDTVQTPSGPFDISNPVYSELPSNPPAKDIYSTAQLPTIPSDSPQAANFASSIDVFTTVSFNKEDDSCDYATV